MNSSQSKALQRARQSPKITFQCTPNFPTAQLSPVFCEVAIAYKNFSPQKNRDKFSYISVFYGMISTSKISKEEHNGCTYSKSDGTRIKLRS